MVKVRYAISELKKWKRKELCIMSCSRKSLSLRCCVLGFLQRERQSEISKWYPAMKPVFLPRFGPMANITHLLTISLLIADVLLLFLYIYIHTYIYTHIYTQIHLKKKKSVLLTVPSESRLYSQSLFSIVRDKLLCQDVTSLKSF